MANKWLKNTEKGYLKIGLFLALLGFLLLIAVVVSYFYFPSDPVVSFSEDDIFLETRFQGEIINPKIIRMDSPVLSAVNDILKKKSGKWRVSYISYGSRIRISCGFEIVDFLYGEGLNLVIVNYGTDEGRPRQVVSDITTEEYRQIEKTVLEVFQKDGQSVP